MLASMDQSLMPPLPKRGKENIAAACPWGVRDHRAQAIPRPWRPLEARDSRSIVTYRRFMSKADKARLCAEIDAFLSTPKFLKGPQPTWRPNGRQDQLDARWPVEETGGISRAHLAFRYNRVSTNEPSVSLIYQRRKVCRVDVKPTEEWDGNPPQAMKLGLPGQVFGPHIHRWEHNREYVLEHLPPDEWEIPIKEPISHSTQMLGHILAFICDECQIQFTSEQRDLVPPSREDLFK